jgi:hypothetical protein
MAKQTSAGVAIATLVLEHHSDDTYRFTTAAGRQVRLNSSYELSELIKLTCVGAGGIPATKKLFGI